MATWTLSDGTTVTSSGKVTGSSALADLLREQAEYVKRGGVEYVTVAPPPGTSEQLELGNDWHIDCWIRNYAPRYGATITDGPELEMPAYLQTNDEPDDDDDGEEPVY